MAARRPTRCRCDALRRVRRGSRRQAPHAACMCPAARCKSLGGRARNASGPVVNCCCSFSDPLVHAPIRCGPACGKNLAPCARGRGPRRGSRDTQFFIYLPGTERVRAARAVVRTFFHKISQARAYLHTGSMAWAGPSGSRASAIFPPARGPDTSEFCLCIICTYTSGTERARAARVVVRTFIHKINQARAYLHTGRPSGSRALAPGRRHNLSTRGHATQSQHRACDAEKTPSGSRSERNCCLRIARTRRRHSRGDRARVRRARRQPGHAPPMGHAVPCTDDAPPQPPKSLPLRVAESPEVPPIQEKAGRCACHRARAPIRMAEVSRAANGANAAYHTPTFTACKCRKAVVTRWLRTSWSHPPGKCRPLRASSAPR